MTPVKHLAIVITALAALGAAARHATAEEEPKAPPTKSFIYKKTKQADLEIFVHYPPGWKETDKRPGIVFFFGGGFQFGSVSQFVPQADLFRQPGHGGGTGRLPGEVPAWRRAGCLRRGRQECDSLAAAKRRQAGHRFKPHRSIRQFVGRIPRRLLRMPRTGR